MDNTGLVVLSRGFPPRERLTLQGCPPHLANFLSRDALIRATGNSFSVPVVMAVLRQVNRGASDHHEALTRRPSSPQFLIVLDQKPGTWLP